MVNRPDPSQFDLPILACVITALSNAIRNIIARKMGPGETPFLMAFSPCLGVTLASLPFILAIPVNPSVSIAAMFLIGGCFFAGGLLLTSRGFQLAPSSTLAPFHYIQILWGILFGYLLFADEPDLFTWAGCALIIASGVALIRKRQST